MQMANPFRLIRIMNGIIGVRASTKPSRKVLKGLIIVANIDDSAASCKSLWARAVSREILAATMFWSIKPARIPSAMIGSIITFLRYS